MNVISKISKYNRKKQYKRDNNNRIALINNLKDQKR